MNIMLLNTWPVVDSKGGAEKVLCEMANEFVRRNHNVFIVTSNKKQGMPFYKLSKAVRFYNIYSSSKNIWAKITSVFKLTKKGRFNIRNKIIYVDPLNSIYAKEKPDIIIAYNPEALELVTQIVPYPVPVIFMLHNTPAILFDNEKCFYREVLEACDCVQVLIPDDIAYLEKRLNCKQIVSIPNIVPQYLETCNYSSHKIINVGRVDKIQKRQEILIDAFAKVAQLHSDWTVEIWGDLEWDNKYTDILKQKIESYGLEDRVFLMGTTNDVVRKLMDASIFAFPSSHEGFPLALTEAMSIGLPAVGYKSCHAVNQLIKDGVNGYLCDDSVENFAQKLDLLMSSYGLRCQLGKQAKEDMKKYKPKTIWDKWEKLTGKIVSEYSSRL